MKKRLLAVLLACSLCFGLFAGSALAEQADYSKHLNITLWVHTDDNEDGYLADTNDNPVLKLLSEKFNVTFEWQIPPTGSEADQMSIMLGSGDYTDVFDTSFSPQPAIELFEDGVIRDLTTYVEKYMPNYMAYLAEHEDVRKSVYVADGKIIYLPLLYNEATLGWGGLIYDRMILDKMTEGNIQFPSGNEEPTTVNDWEYMLGLMKQYFEAAGRTDYACLIIPAAGFFSTGDLLTGFGTTGAFYVDGDEKIQYGVFEEGFYNYLLKMKDWYEKGYIYQDFASRNSDPFYFPNTALTYGGATGAFYGLTQQLYGGMDIADYGMAFDYRAVTSPLDTENNATALPANAMVNGNSAGVFLDGWVVSVSCDDEKLIRWLQICDYLYGEEGSMAKSYGLTKEQAGDDPIYAKLGMADGAYWFDSDGKFVYNPVSDPFSPEMTIKENHLRIARLPGITNWTYYNQLSSEKMLVADAAWAANGYSACIPRGVKQTVEEIAEMAPLSTACNDYINSMVPKFIMGTETLSEETFAAFVSQVKTLGMDRCIEIWQGAYDRYDAE